jgi:hypothetical protein
MNGDPASKQSANDEDKRYWLRKMPRQKVRIMKATDGTRNEPSRMCIHRHAVLWGARDYWIWAMGIIWRAASPSLSSSWSSRA